MRGLPLVALAACAHPAASTWTESDSHATRHETAPAHVAIAPGKAIDPATIDALDEQALSDALATLGDRAPAGQVALRAARLAHHRGDDALARSLLARAATARDAPDAAAALAAQLAPAVAVDPAVIAVLLPLTGKFAAIGGELRTAIELASTDGAKLVFVDTRGEADGAAAAVEQAAAKGATAILGPVGEREAIAAARAAAMRGIPIGLLAPADGAEPAAGVFRLVSSAADEARAVARIAREDSFATVGVLAPRDDTGTEEAEAFVAEAKRLGLEVTAQGTYDPTGGDLEPDVKTFLNLVPATNPRLAEHLAKAGRKAKAAWSTFSPDVPFTMLYVPDRYDRAALVAAFLPYFNVELRTTELADPHMLMRKHGGRMPQVVQLVGSSGWHHPSLPIRGGPAVQGALIVDFFDGDLGGDAGTQFGTAFAARAGRPASTAAAEVHDAALLVFAARKLAANAADPRAAFRTALARGKLDDGACGASAIGADGEIERAATVLEVSGDELIVAP